ncbi:MAG: zeta toxin family protein [Magnetococcales bacterium]|nr:zeta toxin family protein [Magnetococcales bacterium]
MAHWMWMIAGPNGAGKSSFAEQFLVDLGHRALVKLNADERTLALRHHFPQATQNELNLWAAQAIDREVADHIQARRSFMVETVLSSPKYRDDVLTAKAAGFKFGLIYISLHPPELSPLRVSERIAKGGHAVEAAKAMARYHRSHAELIWFAPQADLLMVFDNSAKDGGPILVTSRVNGRSRHDSHSGLNPALDAALAAAFSSPPPVPLTPAQDATAG